MKKNTQIMLIIIMLFSCSSIEIKKDNVDYISDNSLFSYHDKDRRKYLKNVDSIYASVVDTGGVNIVKFYSFINNRFYVLSYQTDKRYLENHSRSWRMISGEIVVRNSSYLKINSIKKNKKMNDLLKNAVAHSILTVNKIRKTLDLNKYKKTSQYQRHLLDVSHVDFNTLKYKSDPGIVCVDNKNMIAGIQCGSYLLRKKAAINDLLTLFVIYDLKKNRPLRLQIINTGSVVK